MGPSDTASLSWNLSVPFPQSEVRLAPPAHPHRAGATAPGPDSSSHWRSVRLSHLVVVRQAGQGPGGDQAVSWAVAQCPLTAHLLPDHGPQPAPGGGRGRLGHPPQM